MNAVNHLIQGSKRLIALLICVVVLSGCEQAPEQVALAGKTMGTTYHIKYIADGKVEDSQLMQAKIDALLEKVNDQMSTYRPDSELSQFNQYKGAEPVQLSQDMTTVIAESIRLNKLTEGALDVTVGPLVNLWGFGPEARPEKMPTDEELQARREMIGIKHLSLDDKGLSKDLPDLYVDLSTIAKGWGVDVVANFLESQGVQRYLVEVGGELRLKGNNSKDIPWKIAIEKPIVDARQQVELIVQPGDMAMATSGDYRNYFERDGIRYSHIINPKTGKPIAHKVVSVTAIHPSCMTADGLATGLMVLGEKEGLQVANDNGLAIFMIVKTEDGFKEVHSKAFEKYLNK
ncbi:FAD:protein FMN transferase ApbE [Vibrio sp. UCD-FRSSP16_10]|uniref:FAD:protein FMN transferase n=1 Tax=unclassified Vibrio TaxID=2614977 RepID=UPI00080157E7|nr:MULTISPECIES: FAD:protein FMN transferase [unclassified Vibrio]OBT06546.1 FAD:protein FMN transferase ApbE [Vibrio sp. UCD-FRSSP16_30]OBT12243.1 FAD:protein FMN transferase ApbE [Vibrio sp. UCD-FRSSP16_10]